MDWGTFPEETILAALDYVRPRATALISVSLPDFPGHAGHLAARLSDMAARGVVVYCLGQQAGWVRVPEFIMHVDGSGI